MKAAWRPGKKRLKSPSIRSDLFSGSVFVKETCRHFPGLYARSEALVQATRDLDRGRTTPEAVDEQVERDLAELVSVQQAAGLDLLADGMLRWQDVFRPLVEAADGLETGALTRFLDTNTFYRAPSATTGAPKLGGPLGRGSTSRRCRGRGS